MKSIQIFSGAQIKTWRVEAQKKTILNGLHALYTLHTVHDVGKQRAPLASDKKKLLIRYRNTKKIAPKKWNIQNIYQFSHHDLTISSADCFEWDSISMNGRTVYEYNVHPSIYIYSIHR